MFEERRAECELYAIILLYFVFQAYLAWNTNLRTAYLMIISVLLVGVVAFSRILDWIFHENTESRAIDKEIERKQKEKLEQERSKKAKRENEKKNISVKMLSEIEVNQNLLKPLSDFVKVLDGNAEYTEEDKLPNELIFEHVIYSALADKFVLIDDKTINKLVEYYSNIKHVEERYKKFRLIHGDSYDSLVVLELNAVTGHWNYGAEFPSWFEIDGFLRHTKKVYDFGEELIKYIKE